MSMDYDAQLKLQAYLDGELPEREAREIAARLERDEQATALLTELRQTRAAVAGFEEQIRLPESREFYWSKIRRQIEREEPAVPVVEERPTWLERLRYVLVPAAGIAFVALVAYLGLPANTRGPGIETTLADSGAFTYHDYSAGTTLVWLSYPADNKSGAANTDELGTVE